MLYRMKGLNTQSLPSNGHKLHKRLPLNNIPRQLLILFQNGSCNELLTFSLLTFSLLTFSLLKIMSVTPPVQLASQFYCNKLPEKSPSTLLITVPYQYHPHIISNGLNYLSVPKSKFDSTQKILNPELSNRLSKGVTTQTKALDEYTF